MEPVYSRDECVAAIRDYFDFLAKMFMDPAFIIEPPQDGWPSITQEAMRGLGKTEEVIELLRHLPYIQCKPYSNLPECLPGGMFIDWTNIAPKLQTGENHPENELLLSEGYEDYFEGKIPSYCIGLVWGNYIMDNEEPDVILLDTKSGVVHWMDCPSKIRESASPRDSYLIYDSEEREEVSEEEQEEDEQNEDEQDEDEEEEDDEDSDEDEEEIRWGPCWPVRQFFEMLKNQFRELHFIPRNKFQVIDVWSEATRYRTPMPEGYTDLVQAIYHKHGWPDLGRYRKEDCLAELQRELNEKFPEQYGYQYREKA